MRVRTRFAPSPTGYLHIGGARTALFNFLYARHHAGRFILRIEDTDRERSTPESIKAILDGLSWLGLAWDEGPYFQSKRMALYADNVQKLLKSGKAYPCVCSPEELERKRQAALKSGRKPGYDGTCRPKDGQSVDLKPKISRFSPARNGFVVRFLAPAEGVTVVDDLVKGVVKFENAELDDLVIARSDGSPTYNFCAAVDDAEMKISHVIRGDDHLANTPKQILVAEALGFSPPRFAHLPLIMGLDKARLSKRHGATSVLAYQEMGYIPDALLNYLARLGWSHGDQELFSHQELIDKFNLEDVGGSAGIFNPDKLSWLNFQYLKRMSSAKLAQEIKPFIRARGYPLPHDDPWLEAMVLTLKERAKTLVELVDFASFYLSDLPEIEPGAKNRFLTAKVKEPLQDLIQALEKTEGPFTEKTVRAVFETVMAKRSMKLGDLAQPVRVALTGGTVSPGIFEVIAVLGKERTLARLRKAADGVQSADLTSTHPQGEA
jgi:glutamyl-tRNA synthetase